MLVQVAFSIVGSTILCIANYGYLNDHDYLYPFDSAGTSNFIGEFFFNIGVWFIALMNFVPISLLVTLEMINFIQAKFIAWDVTIYEENNDLPCKV